MHDAAAVADMSQPSYGGNLAARPIPDFRNRRRADRLVAS